MEILEKRPICIAELKNELAGIKKRDAELNFRSQRTEEYLNDFSTLKPKEAQELVTKLRGLEVPRLKDEHIVKIVDTLPLNEKHLKTILVGYALTISAENNKRILDLACCSQR